ncbi:hypothetical protein [uncultured Bacteroides sp.]|uniref:hypothetical protein n=1 Tax=uncultured Bacteroides sp. TaxID=162156 RepID=UPI002AA684D1|nr:hypothetical protein [uncultured Bacteroides sp.]
MKRPASLVVGILLLILAFIQLIRFTFSVAIVVNGFIVPVWLSGGVAIFFGLLAFWLLNERKN